MDTRIILPILHATGKKRKDKNGRYEQAKFHLTSYVPIVNGAPIAPLHGEFNGVVWYYSDVKCIMFVFLPAVFEYFREQGFTS